MPQPQRRCQGRVGVLPSLRRLLRRGIGIGHPGPRQRQRHAIAGAWLMLEVHVNIVLRGDAGARSDLRPKAAILDQKQLRRIGSVRAYTLARTPSLIGTALGTGMAGEVAVGGGDGGAPAALSYGVPDFVHRGAGIAVEQRHINSLRILLAAALAGEGRRHQARAILGADRVRRQQRGEVRPRKAANIGPGRLRGAAAERDGDRVVTAEMVCLRPGSIVPRAVCECALRCVSAVHTEPIGTSDTGPAIPLKSQKLSKVH